MFILSKERSLILKAKPMKTNEMIKFKKRVIALNEKGTVGHEAFRQACKEFKVKLTFSMVTYPSSLIHSYRQQLLKTKKK